MDRDSRIIRETPEEREALEAAWNTKMEAALRRIPRQLVEFPQVLVSGRHRLPPICAVYLVLKDSTTVLYIGLTQNLRQRWKGQAHHRWPEVRQLDATHIAWLPMEDVWIGRAIEQHLIGQFAPPLNAIDSRRYTGGSHLVRLTGEELALVNAFAEALKDARTGRAYSPAEALRIAALRYLRGTLFPTPGS